MPIKERKRLAAALHDIANGIDARDALGVRVAGRPRRLVLCPFGRVAPAFGDDILRFKLPDGRVHVLPATEALAIAIKGDTTQARFVWRFASLLIANGEKLPLFWNVYLSYALYAIADGRDANRWLLLVRPRGNRADPLRNSMIRQLVADLEGNVKGAALIARDLGLTVRKGHASRLTPAQIRNIVATPKVPE